MKSAEKIMRKKRINPPNKKYHIRKTETFLIENWEDIPEEVYWEMVEDLWKELTIFFTFNKNKLSLCVFPDQIDEEKIINLEEILERDFKNGFIEHDELKKFILSLERMLAMCKQQQPGEELGG